MLCLGSLVVGWNVAPLLVDHWLDGEFAGGGSARKVAKLEALDERERGQQRLPVADRRTVPAQARALPSQ